MKTVLLKIRVPDGKYCWDGMSVCEHFDNYENDKCDLGIGCGLERDKNNNVLKPKECEKLEESK